MDTKKLALSSMMAAFAIILGYIESILPLDLGIPGIKLGLGNIVIVLVLYTMGVREAVMIDIVRILVVGFMFGNLFSMAFGTAGAVVSLGVMCLMKRFRFHIVAASTMGGIGHNVGQMLAASLLIRQSSLWYYFPFLLLSGLVTGLLVGVVAMMIQEKTEH